MRLYVIRHGESENNLKKRWTGWYDAQLTEKGRADALKAREQLKGISFDAVYSSDLVRAVDTAKLALPGCNPETTPLLREICLGSLENQPATIPGGEAGAQIKKEGYASVGGESYAQFGQRLRDFLKQVEQSGHETAAAFCHGGCMRTLLDIVMGQIMPSGKFICNNCAMAVFEYADENWRLHSWINLD